MTQVLVSRGSRRRRHPAAKKDTAGVRFAFYGRMSTRDHQDPVTSLGWQREVAEETIAGRGVIVAEYFDEGWSRAVSWWDRPAAAALLEAVGRPDRAFDGVVVGEYERAFCGDQFEAVSTVLRQNGVRMWLPEAGGLVDWDSPTHQALVVLLGAQSRREVVRARHRVWAAMRAQTLVQGRCSRYLKVPTGTRSSSPGGGWSVAVRSDVVGSLTWVPRAGSVVRLRAWSAEPRW